MTRNKWTMRCVVVFGMIGPLFGGLPFIILVPGLLPLAYLLGLVPAAIAGFTYACLYERLIVANSSGFRRALLGAGSGFLACALFVWVASALLYSPQEMAAYLGQIKQNPTDIRPLLAMPPRIFVMNFLSMANPMFGAIGGALCALFCRRPPVLGDLAPNPS